MDSSVELSARAGALEGVDAGATLVDHLPPVSGAGEGVVWSPQRLAARFDLLSLLGTGAMGAVYLARDVELDEPVAIKMLRPEMLSHPVALQRFRQEVKLARRVTHPNVARVYDMGHHEGRRFLTMEYIEGETLRALSTRDGPLPLPRVLEIGADLAAGLSAAHRAGILHLDLKPDNVLISREGRVVITDFGIARALSERDPEGEDALVGTPHYMSPEQVSEASALDVRSDIYALGAVLFELITRRRAWDDPSPVRTMLMRLEAAPPDPRQWRPDLPEDFARLVTLCMARDPVSRYPSADAVGAALKGIRGNLPDRAQRICRGSVLDEVRAAELGARKVVVLPLHNGGPAEDEGVAVGLTDDIIDTLASVPGVRVYPRASLPSLIDSDLQVVGERLGGHVVVDGRLHRDGDRVKLAARMISVSDGFELWAQRADRPAQELLLLGEELALSMAAALTAQKARSPARHALHPRALELYLKGRHQYHRFWSDGNQKAIELYEEALELAPDDPLILSCLAQAQARRLAFPITDPVRTREELAALAHHAAERALGFAPHQPEARLALAMLHLGDGRHIEAALHLRHALLDGSGLADGHDMAGRLLLEVGRIDEGIERMQVALALEPRLIHLHFQLARALAYQERWEEAMRWMTPPAGEQARFGPYWLTRARLLLWRRDGAGAAALLSDLGDQTDMFRGRIREIAHLILRGRMGPPQWAMLAEMDKEAASNRTAAFFHQVIAEVTAFAGELGPAMAAVESSVASGLLDTIWMQRCVLLAPLRSDPRWGGLAATVEARARAVREVLEAPGG